MLQENFLPAGKHPEHILIFLAAYYILVAHCCVNTALYVFRREQHADHSIINTFHEVVIHFLALNSSSCLSVGCQLSSASFCSFAASFGTFERLPKLLIVHNRLMGISVLCIQAETCCLIVDVKNVIYGLLNFFYVMLFSNIVFSLIFVTLIVICLFNW